MIYSSKVWAFVLTIKLNIWINIFFEIKILKSYLVWLNIMVIFVIKNWCNYSRWFLISSYWIHCIYNFVPSNNHWVHRWSICSPIHMSNHYWICKHHLKCLNNSSSCYWYYQIPIQFPSCQNSTWSTTQFFSISN